MSIGEEVEGCPYFASRDLVEYADLILCPYTFLIDASIRTSLNLQLDNAVIIIDEAHNIETAARDAASKEFDIDAFRGNTVVLIIRSFLHLFIHSFICLLFRSCSLMMPALCDVDAVVSESTGG